MNLVKNCAKSHTHFNPLDVAVELKPLPNGGEHLKAFCMGCGKFIKFLSKADVSLISLAKEKAHNNKPRKKTAEELHVFLEAHMKLTDQIDCELILKFLNY